MTRIALISDIHANPAALDAVLADIRRRACDRVFCLGDLVGYGPCPGEVIARVRAENIQTVMGNYDEAVGFVLPACGCHIDSPRQKALSIHALQWTIAHTTAEERRFLRALPESLSVRVEGLSVFLNHASLDSITEYIYPADTQRMAEIAANTREDVYVFGHTHIALHETIGGKHMINAGSVGRPKDLDPRAGYMVAEISGRTLRTEMVRVAYDAQHVADLMLSLGIDPSLCAFLRNGGAKADTTGE